MDYFPLNWGKPRYGDEHNWLVTPGSVNHQRSAAAAAAAGPHTRTQEPVVTGTSVVAIKYKDGVMMTTDCLASYGSLARFRDVERMTAVGDNTVVGVSGDISDYQYIQHLLEALMIDQYESDDGHKLGPENVHEYLSRIMYHRRNQFNPLWNTLVVGGIKGGKRFLGCVDLRGTTYQAPSIATGYGAYIAQPILRKAIDQHGEDMTEEQAAKLLDDTMRVLYYRDARSLNKLQRTTVNANGVTISKPYELATNWAFAEGVRGYGA
ncbi:Proteasome subunit beta type-7 [Sorochytrium milnesiophthora]